MKWRQQKHLQWQNAFHMWVSFVCSSVAFVRSFVRWLIAIYVYFYHHHIYKYFAWCFSSLSRICHCVCLAMPSCVHSVYIFIHTPNHCTVLHIFPVMWMGQSGSSGDRATKQTNMIYSICVMSQLLISFAYMCSAKLPDCFTRPEHMKLQHRVRKCFCLEILLLLLLLFCFFFHYCRRKNENESNRGGRVSVRSVATERSDKHDVNVIYFLQTSKDTKAIVILYKHTHDKCRTIKQTEEEKRRKNHSTQPHHRHTHCVYVCVMCIVYSAWVSSVEIKRKLQFKRIL